MASQRAMPRTTLEHYTLGNASCSVPVLSSFAWIIRLLTSVDSGVAAATVNRMSGVWNDMGISSKGQSARTCSMLHRVSKDHLYRCRIGMCTCRALADVHQYALLLSMRQPGVPTSGRAVRSPRIAGHPDLRLHNSSGHV
eukprot:jgi/Botrbrau1/5957/Bobra.0366s0127.1